jgi:hypothetical protein
MKRAHRFTDAPLESLLFLRTIILMLLFLLLSNLMEKYHRDKTNDPADGNDVYALIRHWPKDQQAPKEKMEQREIQEHLGDAYSSILLFFMTHLNDQS